MWRRRRLRRERRLKVDDDGGVVFSFVYVSCTPLGEGRSVRSTKRVAMGAGCWVLGAGIRKG
jgi:hypothetical protein